MKTTKYLYGCDTSEFKDKPYKEALETKIELGMKHYRKLFLKHNKTKDEEDQMFWVEKALRHTRKLIEEMED